MGSTSAVTIDHVKNFFSIDKKVEPLDIVPTATGGLGIDNVDHNPSPSYVRERKGTEYAQKYIEEEERLISQSNASGFEDVMLDPLTMKPMSRLDCVEELSTAFGDACDLNSLDAEKAQEIYSNYCREPVKYTSDLPISNYREQILELININQVVIIQGATGCGKTTQVPQYVLDHCVSLGRPCNIIVTQPRKIAAVSVARRVCQERRWSLGSIVGYQVAMDKKTSPDTCVTYATTGVLLQKLVNAGRMDMYTHVIVDEIHERDQETDFALLLVKKLLRTNSKGVKVILMSATIDTSLFANYFAYPSKADAAPVIEVCGKSKEVTEHYIQELSSLGTKIPVFEPEFPQVYEEVCELVSKLLICFDNIERGEQNVSDQTYAPVRGAVLIFLPGYDEIIRMKDILARNAVSKKYTILPLHSSVTVEEQSTVFRQPMRGYRKIIISTNIAESSITVPDVKYVIDFCLTKSLVCDPETNYTCLQLEWASKANCIQRKGRAGRVDIGRVYRMVPRDFYEKCLPDYSVPEIKRCPLTQVVLQAKKLSFGSPQALLALALDPPKLSDIENAILLLKEVGALTVTWNGVVCSYDGELTFVGQVMSLLPLDVNISKLIILGCIFGCLEECIIIAASLSLKSFFSKPFQKHLDSYKSKLSWADATFSDCLAYYNAYKMWKNLSAGGYFNRPGCSEKMWADQQFIQILRIREVDQLVQELKKRLERVNIRVNYSRHHDKQFTPAEETLILKMVIAGAFFPNYFTINNIDEKDVTRELNSCDPLRTVVISGLPADQGILYYNALLDMMSCCGSRMEIEFEGRKAYIQFERRMLPDNAQKSSKDDNDASVLLAVYYAVKLRQMRRSLELQVFSHRDAENKMEQYRRLMEQGPGNVRKLGTKRMTIEETVTKAKKAPLPSINQLTIKIFISHVITPGHFWARYVDQGSKNSLQFLENTINAHKGRNLMPLKGRLRVGMLVLAPYYEKQGMPRYYRATVKEIYTRDQALVFYIDYGNTSLVKINELREIDVENFPDWLDIPAFAFECQLKGVRPSRVSSGSEWSEEAKIFFHKLVVGRALNAYVYSVVNSIARLEVHPSSSDSANFKGSINDQLIAEGFAEPAEESYSSKIDNEARSRYEEESSYLARSDPRSLALQFPADYLDCKDMRKTAQKVRLHGPSTPLEVTFFGNTRIDYSKSIRVDEDSVNSVTLNPEPQDKSQQFIVAASVSLNQRSNTLKARNTTLMPKIPGLQGLICLLFAPTLELRTDPERRCYTGAICGLGYDPSSGTPLFPDHDMEIIFETMIENSDICSVNAIRMIVNFVLGGEKEIASWKDDHLREIQGRLRDQLLKIISKQRRMKEPEPYRKMYHWKQLPSEHTLLPEVSPHLNNRHLILPPLSAINLSKQSLQEEMLEHLEDLRERASRSQKYEEIKCNICGVTEYSPRSLLLHLDSAKHKDNVAKYLT